VQNIRTLGNDKPSVNSFYAYFSSISIWTYFITSIAVW